MSERVKFNINSYVWFKLTEHGRKMWQEHLDGFIRHSFSVPAPQEDGYHQLQMHDFMNIFGSYIYNGCTVPFETEIQLSAGDLAK